MSDSRITIVGHVGKDPETKFLPNGDALVGVSVAVTERVKKDGEWQDGMTAWYRVATFGARGEGVAETVRKGDLVIATGTFSLYTYEKDGVSKSIPEIKNATLGVVPPLPTKKSPRADEEPAPW